MSQRQPAAGGHLSFYIFRAAEEDPARLTVLCCVALLGGRDIPAERFEEGASAALPAGLIRPAVLRLGGQSSIVPKPASSGLLQQRL